MFGYIKPSACLLDAEEQKLYKAVYCGLCHSLGKICSQSARFTLSYDFAFLALLRMAAEGEQPNLCIRKCPSHPIKGCSMITDSRSLDYCAALSALLGYESIRDKLMDEKGLSHFSARICMIQGKHNLKRALDKYDLPITTVRKHLDDLSALEKQNCRIPDLPAEIFGQMLAEVSSYGLEDDLIRFAVEKIMFRIGKWIYLIDAADDFERDQKKGSYNPFLPSGPDKKLLSNSLEWELSHCDDIFGKLPCRNPHIQNIIENIMFYGMKNVANSVLFPSEQNERNLKRQ
ncbi:MAG: hypothetical protein E7599_05430 [Ruminococcaceae bacterium]|nr:hypothetical protein [Oscillospiraceae bacterium]